MAYTPTFPGLDIPNFMGGVNESIDETLIKPNECIAIQNFNIERGTLCTSPGITQYTTGILVQAIDNTIIPYYHGNTSDLLVFSGGKLYRLETNNTFTTLDNDLTAGNKLDYINFSIGEGDVLIYGNGVDSTKLLNGSTVRTLKNRRVTYDTNNAPNGYVDALNNTVALGGTITTLAPKLKYIELHYERVWGAGDTTEPDRLYFSTANVHGFDPEDWTYPTAINEANQHGGFIDIPTNDGGHIIGLKVIFDDVVVFKRNNIFKIFGSNPNNYTKTQIFSANGGIADKTIVAANNKAYFVAKDGIYMYDGTNVAPIHIRMKNTFDTINKDYINNSVGVFHKNHYILAVPEGSSTVNNLIIDYDTIHNNFTFIRGFVVNSFTVYNDQLLFVDNTGKIFIYGVGNTWSGNNIDSYYETGYKDLGFPNAVKTSQFLYFTGSSPTGGSVKFTATSESKTISKTVALTSTNKPYRIQFKIKGRSIKLRIENISGSQITIKSPKLLCDVDYD